MIQRHYKHQMDPGATDSDGGTSTPAAAAPATPPAGGAATPSKSPAPAAPPAAPALIQADLTAAVEKARGEEKQKLYSQIDSLKKDVLSQTQQVETLTATLSAVPSKGSDTPVDVAAIAQQAAKVATDQVTAAFQTGHDELTARVGTLEAEKQALTVDKLRSDAIKAAGGEGVLISAMVTGTTPEEIAASVEASKAQYQVIANQVTASATPATVPAAASAAAPGAAPPVVPPPAAAGGGKGTAMTSTLESVRGMSMKEFSEKRAEIKKSIKGRYVGVAA